MARLALTGWSGGPAASRLTELNEEAIVETAIADLAKGLGVDRRKPLARLVDGRVFNWQADPFSRGAYSYAAVGGAEAGKELAQPMADTLFFAGEATDDLLPATVAGAIRSGYRAAQQLLHSRGS